MLVGAAALFGTPHLRLNCTCRDYRWDFSCGSCRTLVRCNYFGVQGGRAWYPQYDERCGWVRLFPLRWKALFRPAQPPPPEPLPYLPILPRHNF